MNVHAVSRELIAGLYRRKRQKRWGDRHIFFLDKEWEIP